MALASADAAGDEQRGRGAAVCEVGQFGRGAVCGEWGGVMGDYLDNNKPMGANVKKLLSLTMARIAVPPGGGMAAGIEAMLRLPEIARQGMVQVEQMLAAVKAAPDNPYGDNDEVIAGVILDKVAKREGGGE